MQNKYQQLKVDFLSEFVLGKHLPGTCLPSEREIAESYGVSRVSVRHAIEELLKDGYLEKLKNGRNVICGLPVEQASRKLLVVMRNLHSVLPDIYRMLYEALLLKCSFSGISLFCCEEKLLPQIVKKGHHFNAVLGIGFDPQTVAVRIPADRFIYLDELMSGVASCIATDNYAGGRMAAEHLYQCSCRQVILVGIAGQRAYLPFEKRKQGFLEYMHEHKIPVSCCEVSNSSPLSCFAALQACPELGKADGMFVIHDYLAVNVIQALRKLEITVPEKMSVIGFDGIPCGEYLLPPLTTVAQPVNEIADRAIGLILSEKTAAEELLVPPRLVLRKSTKIRE